MLAPTTLGRRLRDRERRASIAYAVGGICAGLVATVLMSAAAFRTGILPFRASVLATLVYSWPLVLVIWVAATLNVRGVVALVAAYIATLVAIGTWIWVTPASSAAAAVNSWSSTAVPLQALAFWGLTQFLPTAAILLVLSRWTRAVGPLMLLFSLLTVMAIHASLIVTLDGTGLVGAIVLVLGAVEMREWAYPPEAALGLLKGGGVGLTIGLASAWLINRWIARRYARKLESDQTALADAMWAIFALSLMPSLFIGGGAWACAAGVIPVVHKGAARLMRDRALRTGDPRGPELLWLRRFRGGSRTSRCYRVLTARWRWIGPVHLIAAPDTAWQTVEPYRFLDFLSWRLRRHFIITEGRLRQQLSALDVAPDPDGHFRVNEFFCGDSLWRAAVGALVRRSHVIVMDLRGVGEKLEAGVKDELRILVELERMERLVVFCTSQERQHVRAALQDIRPGLPEPSMMDPRGRERAVVMDLCEHLARLHC